MGNLGLPTLQEIKSSTPSKSVEKITGYIPASLSKIAKKKETPKTVSPTFGTSGLGVTNLQGYKVPEPKKKLEKIETKKIEPSQYGTYMTSQMNIAGVLGKEYAQSKPKEAEATRKSVEAFYNNDPFGAALMDNFMPILPVTTSTKNLLQGRVGKIDTSEAQETFGYKAGEMIGQMAQFLVPYASMGGAIENSTYRLLKIAGGKSGAEAAEIAKKAIEIMPKAKKYLTKFGVEAVKDIAIGIPINTKIGYELGYEDEELAKFVAINSAFDLALGGAIQGIPAVYRWAKLKPRQRAKLAKSVAEAEGIPEKEVIQMMAKSMSAETPTYKNGVQDKVLKGESLTEYDTPDIIQNRKYNLTQEATVNINTPERATYREGLVNDIMASGSVKTEAGKPTVTGKVNKNKEVDFITGNEGSGKSTLAEVISKKKKSRIINVKKIASLIPESRNGKNIPITHAEASQIASEAIQKSIDSGDNLVIPMIGNNLDELAMIRDAFKEHGYTVNLHNIDLPVEKALERTAKQSAETGIISDPYVMNEGIANIPNVTYEDLKKGFDTYEQLGNDGEIGKFSKIESSRDGTVGTKGGEPEPRVDVEPRQGVPEDISPKVETGAKVKKKTKAKGIEEKKAEGKPKKDKVKVSQTRSNSFNKIFDIGTNDIEGLRFTDFSYIEEHNVDWVKQAWKNIQEDFDGVYKRIMTGKSVSGGVETHEAAMVMKLLTKEAERTGATSDYDRLIEISKQIALKTRESARAMSAMKEAYEKGSFEEALLTSNRVLNNYLDNLRKNKPNNLADAENEVKELVEKLKSVKTKELNPILKKQIERLEKMGVKVQWVDGGIPNGTYKDGVITLNRQSKTPITDTFFHELTHHLEDTNEYSKLSDYAHKYGEKFFADYGTTLSKIKEDIRLDYLAEGVELTKEGVDHEFVSMFTQHFLFKSDDAINKLFKENRSVFEAIYDTIARFLSDLKGYVSSDGEFIAQAERLYRDAFQNSKVTSKEMQNSLDKVDEMLYNKGNKLSVISESRSINYGKNIIEEIENGKFNSSKENRGNEQKVGRPTSEKGIQPRVNGSPSKGVELGFKPLNAHTNAKQFNDSIGEAAKENPFGAFVEVKGVDAYSEVGVKLFTSTNKSYGFAVKPDGDLVSVFSNPKLKSADEHPIDEILMNGLENGGNKLDCFDGFLFKSYSDYGFVPYARVKFDAEYAPDNWNFKRDGEPDIVFMMHNGDSLEQVAKNKGNYPVADPNKIPYSTYDEADELKALIGKKYNTKLSVDSTGKELHPNMAKFMEDSKARDENGILIRLYHNTDANFTKFDLKLSGSKQGNTKGKGFYFSKVRGLYGEEFGKKQMEVYVNLKNPYIMKQAFTPKEAKAIIKKYSIGNIEKQRMEYLMSKLTKGGNAQFEMLDWLSATRGMNRRDILIDMGYDGIIDGHEVVAFNSNQVKDVTNTNPTGNPDIQMSIGEDKFAKKIYGDRTSNMSDNNSPLLDKYRYWEDEASVSWLDNVMANAKKGIETGDMHGRATYVVKDTGGFKEKFMINPKEVMANVKGGLNFEKPKGLHLESIQNSIKEKGYDTKETITIWVDVNGDAWIMEGNHRLNAATNTGVKEVPIRLEYKDGGERADGYWKPDIFLENYDKTPQLSLGDKTLMDYVNQSKTKEPAPKRPRKHKLKSIANFDENTSEKEIYDYVMRKHKIPTLTGEDVAFMKKMADYAKAQPENSYEQRRAYSEITTFIGDLLPASNIEKFKAAQRIMMLLNLKSTVMRNPLGNMLLNGIEELAHVPATFFDSLLSRKTGVRTNAITVERFVEGAKGGKVGFGEWAKDLQIPVLISDIKVGKGITSSLWKWVKSEKYYSSPTGGQLDIVHRRIIFNENNSGVFKKVRDGFGKAGNGTHAVVVYILQLGDRPFYKAGEASRLAELKVIKAKELNPNLKGKELNLASRKIPTTEEMLVDAKLVALERTLQNDSWIANKISKIGTEDSDPIISKIVATLLIPFKKTPANILDKVIDYSIFGIAKTTHRGIKLAKSVKAGQAIEDIAFNQKAFTDTLGRFATGTGITTIGYLLAANGLITGSYVYGKLENLETALGKTNYAYKFEVLGKTLYATFDWAFPATAGLAMGADIYFDTQKSKTTGEKITSGVYSSANVIFESTLMRTLVDYIDTRNPAEGVIKGLLGTSAQLIPTVGGQARNLVDPYKRETYSPNMLQKQKNVLINKIPFASKSLPKKHDIFGEEVLISQGNRNFWNLFVSPSNTTEFKPSKVQKELLRLSYVEDEDGNRYVSQIPPLPNKTFEASGDRPAIKLTTDEYSAYQKALGDAIMAEFEKTMGDKMYNAYSDKIKVAKLSRMIRSAKAKTKREFLEKKGY